MSAPHYGDGMTYRGECLCHGVQVEGPVTRSRPHPFMTSSDPFGPADTLAVLLSTATGAHDVPVAGMKGVAK